MPSTIPTPQQTERLIQRAWELISVLELTPGAQTDASRAAAKSVKDELRAIGWRPHSTQVGI